MAVQVSADILEGLEEIRGSGETNIILLKEHPEYESARGSFYARLKQRGHCWEWTGYKMPRGYGKLTVAGTQFLTHRFAFLLANGFLVVELNVCHKCDNPGCCNADDLFQGTQADNLKDMVRKGRERHDNNPRGIHNGRAKLNDQKVKEIRRLYKQGVSQRSLGRTFGVDKNTIRLVIRGRTWAHVN